MKHRQGRDEWIATIQKMIETGAEGTPEQFKEVLDYLAKNFGPAAPSINVNKASAADLESGLGLTAKEAAAIGRREEHVAHWGRHGRGELPTRCLEVFGV